MKNIVVGDLHGNVNLANEILENFWLTTDHIIFVGDYFDSFDFSVETQIKLIELLLDAQKRDPEKIVMLAGNHELSYLIPGMRCSGHNNILSKWLYESGTASYLQEKLKTWVHINGWLITHAGVSLNWIPDGYREMDVVEFLKIAENSENDLIYQIGRSRGGFHPCGGPFWCDFWHEFRPIAGVKQIFGHTSYRPAKLELDNVGILELYENQFLIDCLLYHKEVLAIHSDGTPEIVRF